MIDCDPKCYQFRDKIVIRLFIYFLNIIFFSFWWWITQQGMDQAPQNKFRIEILCKIRVTHKTFQIQVISEKKKFFFLCVDSNFPSQKT